MLEFQQWAGSLGRETVHNIVDGGWHDEKRLVLTTDNTSEIVRHH